MPPLESKRQAPVLLNTPTWNQDSLEAIGQIRRRFSAVELPILAKRHGWQHHIVQREADDMPDPPVWVQGGTRHISINGHIDEADIQALLGPVSAPH